MGLQHVPPADFDRTHSLHVEGDCVATGGVTPEWFASSRLRQHGTWKGSERRGGQLHSTGNTASAKKRAQAAQAAGLTGMLPNAQHAFNVHPR